MKMILLGNISDDFDETGNTSSFTDDKGLYFRHMASLVCYPAYILENLHTHT
jgi:hypothetical protein